MTRQPPSHEMSSGPVSESSECIAAVTPVKATPSKRPRTPAKAKPPLPTATTTTPKKRPVVEVEVEIASPRKRVPLYTDLLPKPKRTPLAHTIPGSPGSNRPSTPTPRKATATPVAAITSTKKATTKPAKGVITPVKKQTAVRTPAKLPASSAKKGTLASSVSKALPTPGSSRKRRRVDSPEDDIPRTSRNAKGKGKTKESSALGFDETFGIPKTASREDDSFSRETFLANEKLRKQREARNFEYEGDVNAPKLTRSGRVIGRELDLEEDDDMGGQQEEEEILADGDIEMDGEVSADAAAVRVNRSEMEANPVYIDSLPMPEETRADDARVEPLLPEAKELVLDMLATLTGRQIALEPPPFPAEEKNEALNGVLNLLRGTVERGEGNSALLVGARGVGKTRTITRALKLLPSSSTSSPIIVRLSGHAQTNDRLAIKEMGRQIAEAEGIKEVMAEEEEETEEEAEYAPTTLPSHLLALITAPSPRAIIIIMEEFDLFTEHARQALLYCLLDVVQSVKTGPVETTGRGVAVIGITSRLDTLLLLEKRVKSRFSHRMWRVMSPLSPDAMGWKELLRRALVPWEYCVDDTAPAGRALAEWKGDWQFAIDTLLDHDKVTKALDRLCDLTTDVKVLYRPFITAISDIVTGKSDFLSVPQTCRYIISQTENSSWGLSTSKLKGLPHPSLGVLIISKHLSYAGREEFTFAMVEEEYLRFARTKLVGSGRTRWPLNVLKSGFDHLVKVALLVGSGSANVKPRFAKVRCTLSPHEIVGWMKGEGAAGLGPEMVGWGRLMGGHV